MQIPVSFTSVDLIIGLYVLLVGWDHAITIMNHELLFAKKNFLTYMSDSVIDQYIGLFLYWDTKRGNCIGLTLLYTVSIIGLGVKIGLVTNTDLESNQGHVKTWNPRSQRHFDFKN